MCVGERTGRQFLHGAIQFVMHTRYFNIGAGLRPHVVEVRRNALRILRGNFLSKGSFGTATWTDDDKITLDLQKRVLRIDESCYFHATSDGQL